MGRMVMPYSMPVFVLDTFFADRVSVYVMQVEKKREIWYRLFCSVVAVAQAG